MTTTAVELSVVVPTVGRAAGLERLVRRLGEQAHDVTSWELIVVDNGSSPTATLPGDVALPRARCVHEPTPGAAAARNAGIAVATGRWVALLDDDVVPARDWLASLSAALDDTVDGLGGPVVLDPTVALPGWMDASLAGFVTSLDLGPRRRPLAEDEYVLTANAAVRAEWLRRVPFDPRLGPRPGAHLTNDDLDLVGRLRAAGARLAWVPDVRVVHDAPADRLTVRWLARRAHQQGRSDRLLDAPAADRARWGGLRAGWWHLRARVGHWWRDRDRVDTFLAHVLAEGARAVGWWQECLRARSRRRPEGST